MDKKTAIFEKIFDIMGEILALLTIILYAVLFLNANFNFIPAGKPLDILQIIKDYAALVVVGIVGCEAIVKRGFIFKVLFLLLVAIVVIAMFFPGTWQNISKVF